MTSRVVWRGRGANPSQALRIVMKETMRRVYNATGDWVEQMNRMVLQVTPLDTEDLRKSQYTVRETRLNGVVIETGFNTPYAPFVHEWPPTVNWTTPGTSSKFLERPYYSNAYNLPQFIKARVRI